MGWFLLILLISLSLNIAATEADFEMDFRQLEIWEINVDFKEDAKFIRNHPVELVCHGRRNYANVKSSYGGIVYITPYHLWLMHENRSLSFTTEFVVEVVVPTFGDNPADLGNGFSFFLSPDNESVKTPFGFPSESFSVAFDNRIDASNPIPTDTYVTVFRDSLFPNISTTMDFNLHVGQKIEVQIVYKGDEQNLLVYVKDVYNYKFPPSLVLNRSVDLGAYMLDHGSVPMFIGISAVSKTCSETYKLDSWKFHVEKPQIRRRRTSSLMIVVIVIGTIVVGCVILILCMTWVRGWFASGGVGALVNKVNIC